jgi:hypothetical protein
LNREFREHLRHLKKVLEKEVGDPDAQRMYYPRPDDRNMDILTHTA